MEEKGSLGCDEFTIKLLESLRDQFNDKANYSGVTVRLRIDGMIRRMET